MSFRILRKRVSSVALSKGWFRYRLIYWSGVWRRLRGDRWGSSRKWSEGNEDSVLLEKGRTFLEDGFYVDVGANLPMKRSNSYRLYCAGMNGLCIEPNLELASLYERLRPRDQVVNLAVGPEAGGVELQRFNFHVYSTCLPEEGKKRLIENNPKNLTRLLRTALVGMLPLRTILESSKLAEDGRFFLLKVDTEGFDLKVLKSNDWVKYRPYLVLTEATGEEEEVASFLIEQGYELSKKFGVNQLFQRVEK